MAFDPRCVAFEGRLHADRCTAEYIGRANHDSDAACFHSSRAVTASPRSQMLQMFYFETQILATCSSIVPVRINTSNPSVPRRRHRVQDPETTIATIDQDQRRQEEVQAMDREDVLILPPSRYRRDEILEIPVTVASVLTSRTRQHTRPRNDQRQCPRSTKNPTFHHQIAIGFILNQVEPKTAASGGFSSSLTRNFATSNGLLEARVSRRAVKQVMQRVLPNRTTREESEEDKEQRESIEKQQQDKTGPIIWHQEVGKRVNSVAYVGKTGRVISHGREVLQCERYGTGDVVGCGVLLDTHTFFFTLNGKLMGLLAARDVGDLDDFKEGDDVEEEEKEERDVESSEEDEIDSEVGIENNVQTQLDRSDDDMEEIDRHYEDEKMLFASVSLHGVGECVRAVFEPDEFQFDLSVFEQQIQKKRQYALLAEREKRSENDCQRAVEQSLCKDEAAMNELVQDFFLHYGYVSAYKAFKSALVPPKRQRLASDDSDEVEASAVQHDVSCVDDTEDNDQIENMDSRHVQPSMNMLKNQMCKSLRLRHEVCKHIRCFRTAQVLAMLEQPALMKIVTGYRSRRLRKLILYCRILCVIDVLISDTEAKATSFSPSLANDEPHSLRSLNIDALECNEWNSESAIKFARRMFGSSAKIATNGKRKRLGLSNGKTQKKHVDRHDIALAMSLLLYDQRDSIPKTSHARKFLTSEFRESVIDQLNSLLLICDNNAKTEPRVSALETFLTDLEDLRKECLYQGCRVYPESVEATSNGKFETTSRRWRASVSSSSDDPSSSQSEQDDRFNDEDNDDE